MNIASVMFFVLGILFGVAAFIILPMYPDYGILTFLLSLNLFIFSRIEDVVELLKKGGGCRERP